MNPFSFGTVVKGNQFFDREIECDRIVSTLMGGNNLVLFAPRRYGKTSLVFKAIEEMEKQGAICIYFDFLPIYSVEVFVSHYVRSIVKKQTNFQKFMEIISETVKSVRPILSIGNDGLPELGIDFVEHRVSSQTLSDILDLPQKLVKNNQKVIVIFDEFQEITNFEKIGFENLLRSKIQHQKVNYLFLGSRTHLLNDMFNNKKRAFYNSAFHMQLGFLPLDKTIVFLKNKFSESGIIISDELATYIIKCSAKIPYYIQMLAAEIWQYLIKSQHEVTIDIVDLCVKQVIILKHDYYYELFDKLSVLQKNILKALTVNGDNIFSNEYLKKHRLSTPSSIQKAISVLMDKSIIDKTANTYFISDPFFQKFILNYA